MAYATVNKTVVTTINGVTLNLDKDEAQFLFDLTHRIGGDHFDSRRAYSDRILNALYEAGMRGYDVSDIETGMVFKKRN
jgi:hypothetical protein